MRNNQRIVFESLFNRPEIPWKWFIHLNLAFGISSTELFNIFSDIATNFNDTTTIIQTESIDAITMQAINESPRSQTSLGNNILHASGQVLSNHLPSETQIRNTPHRIIDIAHQEVPVKGTRDSVLPL